MHLDMLSFLKKSNSLLKKSIGRPRSLVQLSSANRFSHQPCFKSSNPLITSVQKPVQIRVGIFWDLDNKPPNSVTPYEAATRLKVAAISFGVVRYMFAYANRHAFSHVPPSVREQRKDRKLINQLENKGVIKPLELYLCRVCGRKFHTNEKLLNHFKIHQREHQKRLNQIDSAKGKRRVNLVGKYAMKMEKYQYASRDLLTPKEGYGLADDLKRAGFHVQTVSDKPQAADAALRNHMIDMMDHTQLDCVVLVSDDSDFVGVLKEAKERSVKTVVVGDFNDGVLKRNADACFSWKEILMGKAKKEVVSIVGRWKDRDVLKRLEWSYDPLLKRFAYGSDHEREVDYVASSDDELENLMDMEDDTSIQRR